MEKQFTSIIHLMKNLAISFLFFFSAVLLLNGCSSKEEVRHLSGEVCLITPGLDKNQVLALLGSPEKTVQEPGKEIWIYYQVQQSTLRKTPLVGEKMGSEKYDVVTITFQGDAVTACIYRRLSEEEFSGTEQDSREQLGD